MSDPVNHHPHSRYTLHEKAGLYPFKDLIWNKTDGPFIDLKVDFPDPANHYADGTAYLRTEDVIEMAHCLGMSTKEEVDALKKEIEELKAKLLLLPTKVESFKDELSGITTSFLASLTASVPLAVADEKADGSSKPNDDKEYVPITAESAKAGTASYKGTKRDDPDSSKSDESTEQSSDEPIVGKGPNELSGPNGNSADPLADFFGITGKD